MNDLQHIKICLRADILENLKGCTDSCDVPVTGTMITRPSLKTCFVGLLKKLQNFRILRHLQGTNLIP